VIPLQDIPAQCAGDPQLALANVRQHVPGVLVPVWTEPDIPRGATAAQQDTIRREAVYLWVVNLCKNAGTVVPVNNLVQMALAQARSVPEPIDRVARADDGDRLLANLRARRTGTPSA
jgi:hypothetical protein